LGALEDALSTYRRIGDKRMQATACNLIAQAHCVKANWREALKRIKKAIELAEESDARKKLPYYKVNLGLIQVLLGEYKEAEKNIETAIDELESFEDLDASAAYLVLALLAICRRQWKKARIYLRKSLQCAEDWGNLRNMGIAYEYLGELSFEMGRYDEAFDYYNKVMEILENLDSAGDFLDQIERRKSDLFLARGSVEDALEAARRAIRAAKALGNSYELALSLRALGLALKEKGEREEALNNLRRSVTILEELGEKYERARTYIHLAKLLTEAGYNKEATTYLIKANDLGRTLSLPYIQGQANLVLAKLMLQSQDTDGALFYLDEAESILEDAKELELLEDVKSFRRKVESYMVEAAINASKGFSLLEKWRITNSLSIEAQLRELAKQLQAESAYLAISENGGDYRPLAAIKLRKGQIDAITNHILSLDHKSGVPIAASRVQLDGMGEISYIAIPFDVGNGTRGFLFLSRSTRIPFNEEQITFLSLSSELFVLKLQLQGKEELLRENLRLKRELQREARFLGIVTRNRKMLDILTLIDRIRSSSVPILLQGETGTGKELIARAIHYCSDRRDKPFIPLNCANIPESLLESELFGHKRGAFTDAKEDKKGWFEVADGGTIFLDEIAEMGISAQAKILRFLEHHEVLPIGARNAIKVDVRIIAATNKDLEKEVREGRFREDLYYRLKVFQIHLPPLRERKEDIPILVNYFVEKFSKEINLDPIPKIHPQTMKILLSYDWPGNVRELENEIRRAVIILPPGQREITPDLLSIVDKLSPNDRPDLPLEEKVNEFERSLIEDALKRANGVKIKAAELLGIPESTLRRKIKKYGL
jgi:transcriptional regulator with GAF, ATPase, and Fis domain